MGTNEKPKRSALPIVLVVIGVLVVLIIVVSLQGRRPASTEPLPKPLETPKTVADAKPATEPTPAPVDRTHDGVVSIIVTPVLVAADDGPTPSPTFNPEDQPRKLHILDFRELSSLPEGYKLDGVKLTDKGFELPPPKPGEEDVPRFGTVESPAHGMDFPSNAVSPLWMEEVPEGANVFLEISVSPDGQTWGIWHPVEPDDDVMEIGDTFPDGRPNPNAGHTAGGVFFWGFRQFNYYRFRATLSSEVKESPVLMTFHNFYQDSTFGEGHIAELREDEIQPNP